MARNRIDQTSRDILSHPDKLTFQVVHQSSTLLMNGASWELEWACAARTDGSHPNWAQFMRRGNAMLEYPSLCSDARKRVTIVDAVQCCQDDEKSRHLSKDSNPSLRSN